MRVERNVLWSIAVFTVIIAGVYGLTAAEDAGATLLFVSGVFAAMTAAYLWVQDRDAARGGAAEHPDPWFPHASIWPFVIGVAAFFLFNGLILGSLFLVPGGALLTIGLAGWTTQTRNRT